MVRDDFTRADPKRILRRLTQPPRVEETGSTNAILIRHAEAVAAIDALRIALNRGFASVSDVENRDPAVIATALKRAQELCLGMGTVQTEAAGSQHGAWVDLAEEYLRFFDAGPLVRTAPQIGEVETLRRQNAELLAAWRKLGEGLSRATGIRLGEIVATNGMVVADWLERIKMRLPEEGVGPDAATLDQDTPEPGSEGSRP